MGSDETTLPPAGWYDDPDGRVGIRRYWDGAKWTDRYEDEGGRRPIDEIDRRFKSLYTVANVFHVLGWVTAVLGTLFVIIAAIAAGSADDTTTRVFGEVRDTDPGANAAVILIGGGIGVFIYTLTFFAAAAFIRLMLRVEDNSFRTAAAVERLIASGRGAEGASASG
jgi:uncharacterized protein DUF2510